MKYREMQPSGKCSHCGINLWAEHGNAPAPIAMPCGMEGCPHKTDAKLIPFQLSSTGSSLADLQG